MRINTVKRAIIIALIVGTILNLINQWDAILYDTQINWLKLCLTYCVPFIVSLVSSWLALRDCGEKNL
tara:strand:+ start:6190 stop:6393 length:204 start_codon:yes stop_codon:yes gene_type:complete